MSDHSKRYPTVQRLYRQYLEDEDTAGFIAAVAKRYTLATLERLVRGGSRITRRAALMAVGFLGNFEANAVMGCALRDSDRGVRLIAENGIRSIWSRAGSEAQQQRLRAIVRLNGARQFEQAAAEASELIEQAPWFAEAWNQRGIAHFHLKRFSESIRDGHQSLELNPYHFAAAAGMGQCYLELDDPVAALESFRRALKLHPDLEGVRAQVAYLQRALEGK